MTQQASPSPNDRARWAVCIALERIFVPIARLVLNHRIPIQAVIRLFKRAMVQVANEEFRLPGRRQSMSRIAMLSGLTRADVRSLLTEPRGRSLPDGDEHLKPMAVVEGWRRNSDFLDEHGEPRVLPAKGPHPSFTSLVQLYGGDLPPKTMLEEYLRAGTMAYTDDDRVRLVQRAYIPPGQGSPQIIQVVAQSATRLLSTGVYNIHRDPETEPTLFQRQFEAKALPPDRLEEFRAELQELLARYMDDACGHIEAYEDETAVEGYHQTAGVGMYYFED